MAENQLAVIGSGKGAPDAATTYHMAPRDRWQDQRRAEHAPPSGGPPPHPGNAPPHQYQPTGYGGYGQQGGYGKGPRGQAEAPAKRRTIDFNSQCLLFVDDCLSDRRPALPQNHYSYLKELRLTFDQRRIYDAVCSRFVHTAHGGGRTPINAVSWVPNGRRLLTASNTGEFCLWNGLQFVRENVLQAHHTAIRALCWTPAETVMLSGDTMGGVKFWDPFFYNFHNVQAHKDTIRDITVSPSSLKFCTCADDSLAKVWDMRSGKEERTFMGHGWDVKSVSWHPTKGLVATGSKDSQIKLWDPRVGEAITTIFAHSNMVTKLRWSTEGHWLVSGGRDMLLKLFDTKTMTVRKTFKGHTKEISAIAWHPHHDSLFTSAASDGGLSWWDVWSDEALSSVPGAHWGPVTSLSYHPLGHLLASGGHDTTIKFWARPRPGEGPPESFAESRPPRVPREEQPNPWAKKKADADKAEETKEAKAEPKPSGPHRYQKVLEKGLFGSAFSGPLLGQDPRGDAAEPDHLSAFRNPMASPDLPISSPNPSPLNSPMHSPELDTGPTASPVRPDSPVAVRPESPRQMSLGKAEGKAAAAPALRVVEAADFAEEVAKPAVVVEEVRTSTAGKMAPKKLPRAPSSPKKRAFVSEEKAQEASPGKKAKKAAGPRKSATPPPQRAEDADLIVPNDDADLEVVDSDSGGSDTEPPSPGGSTSSGSTLAPDSPKQDPEAPEAPEAGNA